MKLTEKQQRVKKIVKYLKEYINTYDNLGGYLDYSDETIIDDILYGLSVSLNRKEHSFHDGYNKFKKMLTKHLHTSERKQKRII